MNKIKNYIKKSPSVNTKKLIGCSDNEISEIEKKYMIKLPESYKNVLKYIGISADKLIDTNEYEFYYKEIINLTDEIHNERSIIDKEEEGKPLIKLPDNLFFIMGRYREQFHFIVANNGDDAEVYYYNFDEDNYKLEYKSVWDWIIAFLRDNQKSYISKGAI